MTTLYLVVRLLYSSCTCNKADSFRVSGRINLTNLVNVAIKNNDLYHCFTKLNQIESDVQKYWMGFIWVILFFFKNEFFSTVVSSTSLHTVSLDLVYSEIFVITFSLLSPTKGSVIYDPDFDLFNEIGHLCRLCKAISANTQLVKPGGAQCLPSGEKYTLC